jgi:radical SAM superfamily enzyme YgiQ (UPF0313 family)
MDRLNLTLIAINLEGYSLGVAYLDAMTREHPSLQRKVRSVQLLYDLEQVRHPYFDLSTVVTDLLQTDPDVIGMSCYCWNLDICLKLVTLFNAACPKTHLILGGPEVTVDSDHLFEHLPDGTFLVFDEGEGPLCDLLGSFIKSGSPTIPPGVAVVMDGTLEAMPTSREPLPAQELPSPMRMGLLQLDGIDWMTYTTTRGCMYRCSYCRWGDGKGIRRFSLERIREDLSLLGQNDFQHIWIADTCFGSDGARDNKILEILEQWPRDTMFSFETRPTDISEELAAGLARIPLNWVAIGVQTLNPTARRMCGRQESIETTLKAIDLLYRALPDPRVINLDMIFGLPGDSFESSLESLDKLKATFPLVKFFCSVLHVLPGTSIWGLARKEHWVVQEAHGDHELIDRPGFPVSDVLAAKKIILGIDCLQSEFCRVWSGPLVQSSCVPFSQIANVAGAVCYAYGLHRHRAYKRTPFFRQVNERFPNMFSNIRRSVESQLSDHRNHLERKSVMQFPALENYSHSISLRTQLHPAPASRHCCPK